MELNVSITGLTIQCSGIFLITFLSFFMTRFIRSVSLSYWTVAWFSLSAALVALSIGFRIHHTINLLFYFLYYLGEYVFCYFIYAGCRKYALDQELSRGDLRWLLPLLLFAVALAVLPMDYNVKFIPHFAVLSALFWRSLRVFRKMPKQEHSDPGLRVMSFALVLLFLDFTHYVPIFSLVLAFHIQVLGGYLGFTSLYDLILEMLLGFGIVMVVLEDLRYSAEEANRQLIAVQERLENLARLDPLTEALNRHAFYSLLDSKSAVPTQCVSGCAVVVDIDNLKPINDRLGHSAGDAAIRQVAQALRAVIRADDMLFRWGGDEFLLLLFQATEETIQQRLEELSTSFNEHRRQNFEDFTEVQFSYGIAPFSQMANIEIAIDLADAAMYAHKQIRKTFIHP